MTSFSYNSILLLRGYDMGLVLLSTTPMNYCNAVAVDDAFHLLKKYELIVNCLSMHVVNVEV